MITIHRVVVPVTDKAPLPIPGFIRPLHFEKLPSFQGELRVEMWYEVDTSVTKLVGENVAVFAEGTGHPINTSPLVKYVNTLIWENDGYNRLVFHFYVGWDR